MAKRKHQMAWEVKATPEKGGGKRYVEDLSGKSINELYARLLATGELARAGINKHQTHGTKEQVVQMLEHAKPVALYMNQSQIDKVQKELEETAEKISNLKKSDLYKDELKKKLEELKTKNETKYCTCIQIVEKRRKNVIFSSFF